MGSQKMQLPPHHQALLDRFIAECQGDEQVVAALLVGSNAKGRADEYSDIDLYLITTDEAFAAFSAARRPFIERLGSPVFLEDFDIPDILFFILSDGAEGELYFGRESQVAEIFEAPYIVLLDKKNITARAGSVPHEPKHAPSGQTEKLRRRIYWFWHELSHFITALGRGQLWWAHGQLDSLRAMCVNLARLAQDFSDTEVGDEPYFKVENALPAEKLSPLQGTFCPMERDEMLKSV